MELERNFPPKSDYFIRGFPFIYSPTRSAKRLEAEFAKSGPSNRPCTSQTPDLMDGGLRKHGLWKPNCIGHSEWATFLTDFQIARDREHWLLARTIPPVNQKGEPTEEPHPGVMVVLFPLVAASSMSRCFSAFRFWQVHVLKCSFSIQSKELNRKEKMSTCLAGC